MCFGDDLAVWVGSIATFLAVLVALFKDGFVRYLRRPVLKASIILSAPDCHKTVINGIDECYYFRLNIENTGKQRAENVQVFASKLYKRHGDDANYEEVMTFQPMNLRWAFSQRPGVFAEGISPKMRKHCDLGHIIDPNSVSGRTIYNTSPGNTVFQLELENSPNTHSDLLSIGLYRLEIILAAANAKPITKTIEINHSGEWYSDEHEMFTRSISIQEI